MIDLLLSAFVATIGILAALCAASILLLGFYLFVRIRKGRRR